MTRRTGQLGVVAAIVAAPWITGCAARGGAAGGAAHAERVGPAVAEVGDDGFAAAVHDLLVSDPGTPERATRLGAVESRQMTRADARFKARAGERGLAAVSGGLYLVRVGEAAQGLFGRTRSGCAAGRCARALGQGRRGTRARRVRPACCRSRPRAERPDVRTHIEAIDRWTRDAIASGGPVASAGGLERVQVHRQAARAEPRGARRRERRDDRVDPARHRPARQVPQEPRAAPARRGRRGVARARDRARRPRGALPARRGRRGRAGRRRSGAGRGSSSSRSGPQFAAALEAAAQETQRRPLHRPAAPAAAPRGARAVARATRTSWTTATSSARPRSASRASATGSIRRCPRSR